MLAEVLVTSVTSSGPVGAEGGSKIKNVDTF